MRISKSTEGGKFVAVHKTEVIKKTLDPRWVPFELALRDLNNGDLERALLWEVFDWNKSGKEDFIGCNFFSFIFFFLLIYLFNFF